MSRVSKIELRKKRKELPLDLQHELFTFIPEDDREAFVQQFTSLSFCREHLIDYFKHILDAEIRKSEDVKSYAAPAWAESQADSVGTRRAYRKIIKMLGGDTGNAKEERKEG